MSITKPARRFIAEARELHDHDKTFWGAYWAFPGMVPAWVTGKLDRQPVLFDDPDDASSVAKMTLANALIKRVATTDLPERYRHMTAADFAADLKEAGLTPTAFAHVYGVSQDAVLSWINGVSGRPGWKGSIPHAARVMLALFLAYPDAIGVARRVTEENTSPRHASLNEVVLPS